MPLLNRDLHAELTKTFEVVDKLFQRLMALRIKFAVLEKLVHCLLLSAFEHLLQKTEGNLGDEQFVVVTIVPFHLGALPTYLLTAVVIGPIEML